MHLLTLTAGILITLMVLVDAFETIILPRSVRRSFRLTNGYFAITRLIYVAIGRIRQGRIRQRLLNAFAPLTVLALIATWAASMIVGFSLVLWGSNTALNPPAPDVGLGTQLYLSGITFFTLGFGDVVPTESLGRFLAIMEAGLGFGFLALIIGYVPVMYSAFSRREVQILLLDSRAGSDPTATELLRRHGQAGAMSELLHLLRDWERFSGELLESSLSYPVLAFYRSQHDDQNWLRSLTAIMDSCALIESGLPGDEPWQSALRFQARSTFQMARHVVVDVAYILGAPPRSMVSARLTAEKIHQIHLILDEADVPLVRDESALKKLKAQIKLYEPFVQGLSVRLMMDLPSWLLEADVPDNWQTTAWDEDEHF